MSKPSCLEKETVNKESQMYARRFLGDSGKVAAGTLGVILGVMGYYAGQGLGEPSGTLKALQLFDYLWAAGIGLTGSVLLVVYLPKAIYDSCRAGVKKRQYEGVLSIKTNS